MQIVAPPTWTLDDALALIRDIQPRLHAQQWHVALGGSVLTHGISEKDADLYVLPFSDTPTVPDVLPLLVELLGPWEPIGVGYDKQGIFAVKAKFTKDGRRIDAFVGRNGRPPAEPESRA